jgi:hypothetical protein
VPILRAQGKGDDRSAEKGGIPAFDLVSLGCDEEILLQLRLETRLRLGGVRGPPPFDEEKRRMGRTGYVVWIKGTTAGRVGRLPAAAGPTPAEVVD